MRPRRADEVVETIHLTESNFDEALVATPALAVRYDIRSIPTIAFFKDGAAGISADDLPDPALRESGRELLRRSGIGAARVRLAAN